MGNPNSSKDFVVRVPARFLKDAAISSDAKALRAVLGAFADGRSGRTYVKPSTLEALLGWGRDRRQAAQRELVRNGWLRLGWKRGKEARWARRIFILSEPAAGFARYGRNEQLIIDHNPGVESCDSVQPAAAGCTLSQQESAGLGRGQLQ